MNVEACMMLMIISFGIAVGCVVLLAIFWRVLPWLLRN